MYGATMGNIHLCEYIVNKGHAFRAYEINVGDYRGINEPSAISTPSTGYKVGILNSDGDEKSKRGGSNESKHGSSGGASDHRELGDEGEFVNDGMVDE